MSDIARASLRILLRALAALLVVLVLWLYGPRLWHLLSPFLLAIPVALVLQKPIRWTEKRLRFKHGVSVAVWVLLVCVALCLLLYWLLSIVIGQVISLSENYQTIISDIIGILRSVANQLLDALDYLPASAEEWARSIFNDLFATLSVTATRWATGVLNWAINFASSIPYALIYLNFLLLGIFFVASSLDRIKGWMFAHMGNTLRDRSQMLSVTAIKGLGGYIRVQILYGALVLVVSLPALSLFRVPYAPLIAVLASVLEFLPIFGNGTLYIPFAIICFLIGNTTLGIQMLVLHFALYGFRRVTEPKLMSNSMGISPLLSLVAMFVGMQLGGVAGLILAPVVVVVVQGAWYGGLFAPTLADLRCLIAHIGRLLSDPPPCDAPREDAEPPA